MSEGGINFGHTTSTPTMIGFLFVNRIAAVTKYLELWFGFPVKLNACIAMKKAKNVERTDFSSVPIAAQHVFLNHLRGL